MIFERLLKGYLAKKRTAMKENWNRDLPSNELLYDRWEKARLLNCGENTSIYDTSVIMGDVRVGSNVWIGPYTLIEGLNGTVVIGDHCHISSGVQIVTHDSAESVLTGGKAPFQTGDVRIGNNTYIGGLSIITRNVTVGSRCVIGAGSLVNTDLPDETIAFGTPARAVGKVEIAEGRVTYRYFEK